MFASCCRWFTDQSMSGPSSVVFRRNCSFRVVMWYTVAHHPSVFGVILYGWLFSV